MLATLLALIASAAYGTSDFIGGLRSRSSPLLVVLLVSQGAGLVLLVAVVVSRWEAPPSGSVLAAAAAAGVGEVVAVAALYRGLAIGRMGIVAGLSALSPVLPVVVTVTTGSALSPPQALGIAAAVAGVVGISHGGRGDQTSSVGASVACGLLAAGGFGAFYLGIGAASHGSVPWSLVVARASAVSLLLLAAVVRRPRSRVRLGDLPPLVLMGVLVVGADTLYALAATRGSLGTVAVLASLYPVVTIALARACLHERMTLRQQVGVGLCLAGVVALSAG